MPPSKLVVFGDSVTWGQGLRAEHKFSTLVQTSLAARGQTLTIEMLAHSGATIGVRGPTTTTRLDGEVPVAYPTLVEQVAAYAGPPGDVALILANGGINDVDFRVILNPLTTASELRHEIKQYCHDDMLIALKQITRTFSEPTLRVVVTGYYPILSAHSHPMRIPFLMDTFGVGIPLFVSRENVFTKVVALCMQFWSESTIELQHAVSACNADAGGNRVVFAPVPYKVENAIFAEDPWLFGLNGDFSPQDEVAASRHAACDRYVDAFDIVSRESCYRASAGHPNVRGAAEYAKAITAAI